AITANTIISARTKTVATPTIPTTTSAARGEVTTASTVYRLMPLIPMCRRAQRASEVKSGSTHISAPCTHNMATTMATHRVRNSFDAVTSACLAVAHTSRTVSSSFTRQSLGVVGCSTKQVFGRVSILGNPREYFREEPDGGLCFWILVS